MFRLMTLLLLLLFILFRFILHGQMLLMIAPDRKLTAAEFNNPEPLAASPRGEGSPRQYAREKFYSSWF